MIKIIAKSGTRPRTTPCTTPCTTGTPGPETARCSPWRLVCWAGMLMTVMGCSDLTKDPGLPAGTPDPSIYNTADGAVGLRNGALLDLNGALPLYSMVAGVISDELQDRAVGASQGVLLQSGDVVQNPLDERILVEGGTGGNNGLYDGRDSYQALQGVRGATNIALAALAKYDTAAAQQGVQHTMRSELYALQAYAEILLADLFCSGVPLSTLDFQQDFTYASSSTTTQVYQDALTKLDSALALAPASDSVLNLARVLQGRAFLALGEYANAAAAVASVPDGFTYQTTVKFPTEIGALRGGVADREGNTGLPYVSSNDPRTPTTVVCRPSKSTCPAVATLFPAKYSVTSYSPFMVANSVEARLIAAEAALNAGDATWLTTLNALRTNGTFTTVPADTLIDTLGVTHCGGTFGVCGAGLGGGGNTPPFGQPGSSFPGPGYVIVGGDTTTSAHTIVLSGGLTVKTYCNRNSWYKPCYSGDSMVVLTYVNPAHPRYNAGSGGVTGLAPLADPGSTLSGAAATAARLVLLFQERAYWLFMTGHRQGDLRRSLRQYSEYAPFQSSQAVYPSGIYLAPGTGQYGTDVSAPIPTTEYANPKYHGCLDRKP